MQTAHAYNPTCNLSAYTCIHTGSFHYATHATHIKPSGPAKVDVICYDSSSVSVSILFNFRKSLEKTSFLEDELSLSGTIFSSSLTMLIFFHCCLFGGVFLILHQFLFVFECVYSPFCFILLDFDLLSFCPYRHVGCMVPQWLFSI